MAALTPEDTVQKPQDEVSARTHLFDLHGTLYNADMIIRADYQTQYQKLTLRMLGVNQPIEELGPEAERLWQWLQRRVGYR